MGNTFPQIKDGTAQGVAKVRHYEALLPPDQRLYHDPYAYAMYPGSVVQGWMGPATIDTLYGWMGMTGFQEMISVRTKWLDDQIGQAQSDSKQLLILGAGYDTRGFRLEFPEDFLVLEVDQPEVQTKKLGKLNALLQREKQQPDQGKPIESRLNSKVQFVPVNFNQDSLQDKLKAHPGFQVNQPSIITLEGVTQYIPKPSTAQTLQDIKAIVAPGSTLLITYVDQSVLDHPEDNKACQRIYQLASRVGEPWISAFHPQEFAAFIKDCGYTVVSDTSILDYNDQYLDAVKRKLEDQHLFKMERFVVARIN